jgi:membrane glycosyltransferase
MLNPSTVAAMARTGLPVTQRRVLFSVLVAVTTVVALGLAVVALSPGGLSAVDLLLLALYAIALPWLVIGFSISVIGFCVLQFARDPLAAIFPAAAGIRGDEPITAMTAILICIRNEAPERVIRNLSPLLTGLAAAGVGGRFHVFVLSDTGDPALAAIEEERFGTFASVWQDRVAVTYRRRRANTEFKAGNIRDFCRQWGADYEFALTLDADSFMTADAVLRLVRIMQDDPRLGIVQSLVVGLPSTSAFARLFQFGMRLGMRSYTIGSAWWQADCGPYWGHNALLRLAPFIAHCRLPDLPAGSVLGGHILSHDQIEAVLMRRAGYHVRVLPVEYQSWEENPAALLEFIRRDLRWCHGNLQYFHLLGLPGILPVSRYQLVFAILMFVGSPAWIGLLVAGTLAFAWYPPADLIRPDAGMAVLVLTLVMWLSPKLATFVNVLSRPAERRSFGGTPRFLASAACETVFSLLLAPIMWFGHTLFLARLPFTRTLGWSSQMRDDHAVPLGLACRALWPYAAVGVGSIAVLAASNAAAIPYALLLAAGLALSIPLAVITALPAVGAALMRYGIGRLPEETEAPAALHALALPAMVAAPAPAPSAAA